MKISWKIVLLFILLVGLVVPGYTMAVETEDDAVTMQQEPVAESEVKEDVTSAEEVPEQAPVNENNVEKDAEETGQIKDTATPKEEEVTSANPEKTSAKNLKSLPPIPANSKISDVFPDDEMAAAIVYSLNYENQYETNPKIWVVEDVITQIDLNKLNSIRCEGEDIVSIEGIQYCSNVRTIDLNGQRIKDLSPLAKNNFPYLRDITLSSNEISDVSPLASTGLAYLDSLDLDSNHIADVSSLVDTALAYVRTFYCRNQTMVMEETYTVSSKEALSLELKIPSGTQKYEDIVPQTVTWSKAYMETRPSFYDNITGISGEGVSYKWKTETKFPLASKSQHNSEHKNFSSDGFYGTIYQPLEYILPPKITSYKEEVIYEVDTAVTEEQFLADAEIVTDQETEITSNFNSVVTNVNAVTTYAVTVTASNKEGSDSKNIRVRFKNKPPVITADAEHTYLVGEKVNESQFLLDVHAQLTGATTQWLDADFYKVNLNKAGDYVVTLTAEGSPPFSESAVPVTVIVHVKEALELQVPSEFRMDVNANPDAIPISESKQTLHCYGSSGTADLEVVDRRTVKQGWTITGAMTPFTNTKGDILESPLLYQSQSIVGSPISLSASNQPVEIKQASSQTGYVSNSFNLQDRLTMEISPNDALVNDTYEASITWTLEDVPRP
ncbi:LapB repeat-containing protein [Listeria seeligeri]|uniref:LapB repeat-containing protein n=1 Tax=Listeria seeligeri TaxID=1640 RepID=UPI00162876F1|nr:LapB repeat-containing protein [Listeria seeligeri]MBC1429815.1 LapB repeat-containing protein [Listeria seeligeri]